MNEGSVYSAVRTRAGLVDRSAEGRLEVRGPDRATWLQGLLTNDVVALAPGQGCYAAYLTPQGRMIADVRVLALADRLLLDVPRGMAADLRARFDQLVIMEDVVVTDVSAALARLAVHGPAAAEVVAAAVGEGRSAGDRPDPRGAGRGLAARLGAQTEHASLVLPAHPDAGGDIGAGEIVIAASHDLGLPGFDVYVEAPRAAHLRAALRAGGAVEMSEGTWHQFRVEAGRPCFGVDMTADTIPLEAGLEQRAISFTKGCYVGQEIIVRVRDRGHGRVARRLVGLAAAPAAGDLSMLPPGTRLVAGDREVGHLTSLVWSPALGRTIALGYVHRDFVDTGTAIEADGPAGRLGLTVSSLPFVDGPTGARP